MSDVDRSPHPLVTSLGPRLDKAGQALADLGAALETADADARIAAASVNEAEARGDTARQVNAARKEQESASEKRSVAEQELANAVAQRPEVVPTRIVHGYLGGFVDEDNVWRVIYLDAELQTWIIAADASIRDRRTVKDEAAPTGSRDVIWLDREDRIISGQWPQTVKGRFLSGDFIRFADFEAEPNGGTFPSPSGLFCAYGCTRRVRPTP